MPGWHCFRSKPPAKRRAGPRSRKSARSSIGFLAGQELVWLPEALRILRERTAGHRDHPGQPVFAGTCRRADARQGRCGVSPPRNARAGIAFKFLIKEPLVAVLPAGHRLAAQKAVRLAGSRRRNLYLADPCGAGAQIRHRKLRGQVGHRAEATIRCRKFILGAVAGDVDRRRNSAAALRAADAAAFGRRPAVAGRAADDRSGAWATAARTRRRCSSASWGGRIS